MSIELERTSLPWQLKLACLENLAVSWLIFSRTKILKKKIMLNPGSHSCQAGKLSATELHPPHPPFILSPVCSLSWSVWVSVNMGIQGSNAISRFEQMAVRTKYWLSFELSVKGRELRSRVRHRLLLPCWSMEATFPDLRAKVVG